jgi:hypothetical protein
MIVGNRGLSISGQCRVGQAPDGWSFKEVGGVGVDSRDNVYVFNRCDHPMMVFDRDGNFLRSWGEGQYPRAHGVHVTQDDTMFLTEALIDQRSRPPWRPLSHTLAGSRRAAWLSF